MDKGDEKVKISPVPVSGGERRRKGSAAAEPSPRHYVTRLLFVAAVAAATATVPTAATAVTATAAAATASAAAAPAVAAGTAAVAASATAGTAAVAAAATAASPAPSRTRFTGLRLVHAEPPSAERFVMQAVDRRLSFRVVGHLDKPEPARPAGFAVRNDLCADYLPVLLKQLEQVVGRGIPREVADVNVLRHQRTFPCLAGESHSSSVTGAGPPVLTERIASSRARAQRPGCDEALTKSKAKYTSNIRLMRHRTEAGG